MFARRAGRCGARGSAPPAATAGKAAIGLGLRSPRAPVHAPPASQPPSPAAAWGEVYNVVRMHMEKALDEAEADEREKAHLRESLLGDLMLPDTMKL